jgi:hypothetical protein
LTSFNAAPAGVSDQTIYQALVVATGAFQTSTRWSFSTLGGEEGTGFLIVAIFPPGQWNAERGDFFRVLEAFTSDVPPGFQTFPVAGPVAG